MVIVFKDGSHLERYEYDGSEGWKFKLGLEPPKTYAPLKSDTLKVDFGEGGLKQVVDEAAACPWDDEPIIVTKLIDGYEDTSTRAYDAYGKYGRYDEYGD